MARFLGSPEVLETTTPWTAMPWRLLTLTLMTVPQGSSSVPPACDQAFAYCQRPYSIGGWMEGGQALDEPPQAMTSDILDRHRCFCDSDCRLYGDCCPDALTAMDPYQSPQELEDKMAAAAEDVREWECHPFPMQGTDNTYAYMIGSCPAGFGNAHIRDRCKRRVQWSDYDYTLDLPVMGRLTNLTYVNVYCALCNGEEDLRKWHILMYCPKGRDNCASNIASWSYVPGRHRWVSPLAESISYEIRRPEVALPRKCLGYVIGACPDSWPGPRERTLCRAYSMVVKTLNATGWYKNGHCALCNGESVHLLHCPDRPRRFGLVTSSAPPPRQASYAVLLDFLGPGSRVGGVGACALDCGFGELCDPLNRMCRTYACGRKYLMDDRGACVAINGSGPSPTDLALLDSDCPKVLVTEDRFVRLPNGSVHVDRLRRTLDVGQYEEVNATAILVCANPKASSWWKFSRAQSILSKVCISVSLVSLAAHAVIQASAPRPLNLPGKNLLCLSIALFVAQLAFEFGAGLTGPFELCVAIGLTVHFAFLAAFLWMNVIAVDVFRTLAGTSKLCSSGDGEFWAYSAYAWSTAFLLVLTAATNDLSHWLPGFEPRYGQPLCWINDRHGLLAFFVGPLAILLSANVVLFSLTVAAICRTRESTRLTRQSSAADAGDRLFLYIKLALIMGLTWLFGFVAALTNAEVIWYFFISFNCLQGTFIFLAFSCKKVLRTAPCSGACCFPCTRSGSAPESRARSSVRTILTSMSGKCSSSGV